mgnify:CR=1 FL=1
MLFASVFIISSNPSVASSSEIISAVQWERFIWLTFSRLKIAKPRLKELQFVVWVSVVIWVPPDSEESGLAIWIDNVKGSSSEFDLSIPRAIIYVNSSVPRTS